MENTQKHTPEPWEAVMEPEPHCLIRGRTATVLLSNRVGSQAEQDIKQAVAAYNATYAAGINPGAVPDMVDALKLVEGLQKEGEIWSVDPGKMRTFKDVARAALAKAAQA